MCLQRYILRYFGERLGPIVDATANFLDELRAGDVPALRHKKCCPVWGNRWVNGFGKALIGKVLTGSADRKVDNMIWKNCATYGFGEKIEMQKKSINSVTT